MKASFVLLGLAILSFAGCTIPRTFFATADCDYKRVRLRHWAENSASESATIRVLLVHGMNNHPFGFKGGKPELYGCATYTDLQTKLSGPLNWQQLEELRNLAVTAQFNDFINAIAREVDAGQENESHEDNFTSFPPT